MSDVASCSAWVFSFLSSWSHSISFNYHLSQRLSSFCAHRNQLRSLKKTQNPKIPASTIPIDCFSRSGLATQKNPHFLKKKFVYELFHSWGGESFCSGIRGNRFKINMHTLCDPENSFFRRNSGTFVPQGPFENVQSYNICNGKIAEVRICKLEYILTVEHHRAVWINKSLLHTL